MSWFDSFFVKISLINEYLFCEYMYRQSVDQAKKRHKCVYEHLFYKYFVRLSVGKATININVNC